MQRVMMCLGMFVFSTHTATYDTLSRRMAWRHPSQGRVGARPRHQFLGVDDETFTISGTTYTEIATFGRVSLEVLEEMANRGEAWLLIGGDFKVYGHYLIESLETTSTEFFPDGAARKISFTLGLKRESEGPDLQMGVLSAVANKVLARLL